MALAKGRRMERGGREGGRETSVKRGNWGKKREREREESASNADIRHTTSNAGCRPEPTLKTPLDQL